jgi:signal transduction histidine kinase
MSRMAGINLWTHRLARLSAHAKLFILVLLLAVLAVIALGALGWGLLRESRALDAEIRRRQDVVAREIASTLRSSLHRWQTIVESDDALERVLPAETLLLTFDASGIQRTRGLRVPYVPAAVAVAPPVDDIFAATEDIEYREPRQVADAYRELSRSANAGVRANALVRLAGVQRSNPRDALSVYGELGTVGTEIVAGHPAELIAHRERMRLFSALGEQDAAAREAGLLEQALADGRFVIDRETFDFYADGLPAALRQSLLESLRISGAERLAQLWPQLAPLTTRRMSGIDAVGPTVIVWSTTGDGVTTALVGDIDRVTDNLEPGIRLTRAKFQQLVDESQDVSFGLQDRSGAWALGSPMSSDEDRVIADSSLPWTIHVGLRGTATTRRALMSSTRVLTVASALMVAVLAAAGWVTFRAVRSELDVARRQSEFVAAVSHEFRTPLAAMCHLSEMLEDGGTPPERLPLYFKTMARESRRLRALVESLLDFGRLEAGRQSYEPTPADINDIVNDVAGQCREQIPSAGERLQIVDSALPPAERRVQVDRAAMTIALRNLLDNALKYSPDDAMVTVSTSREDAFVGVSVQDRGPGVPPGERHDIFRKFVRGSAARTLNVKGSGIGLAMAQQIVEDHGGTLVLDSKPGEGSCFTIRLPIAASEA